MQTLNSRQIKHIVDERNYIKIDNIRKRLEENGTKHVSYLSEIRQVFYKEFSELSDETKKLINTWRGRVRSEKYDPNINNVIYPKSNLDFELLNSLEQTYKRCRLFNCNDELNAKYKPFDKINEFKTLFEFGDDVVFFSNKMKSLQYDVDELIRICNNESDNVKPKQTDDVANLNINLIEFTVNDVFEALSIIVKDIEKCELKLGKQHIIKKYERSGLYDSKLNLEISKLDQKLHKLYSEAKYQIYKFDRIYNGDPNGRFYINDKTVAVNNLIKSNFNGLIIGENEFIERFEIEFNQLNKNENQINFELLTKFSKLQSKLDKESFNEIKELIYKNIWGLVIKN